jgi:hypothetical protein
MRYNKQSDARWKNEVMTKSDKWTDYLGVYGCLVSCISNIVSIIQSAIITPKDINDDLKNNNGYFYLKDETTPEHRASFLDWEIVQKLYALDLTRDLSVNAYKYEDNFFWIAKVLNYGAIHFINVIAKQGEFLVCYDVFDGKTKMYKKNEIINLYLLKEIEK